ncbi:MAG: hypothetical protein AMJ79_08865 [Phycisphaerae bacterium SM23_30]|nr:MAG: hypothetical protein AMJ79_08865 [Phycisphaerae bacterium SM23_30]
MPRTDDIVEIFCKINDRRSMEKFFEEIFTPLERKHLHLRWQLMRMLHQDIPQRQIARRLEISLCKITRGAKILRDKKSVTKKVLDKTHKKRAEGTGPSAIK